MEWEPPDLVEEAVYRTLSEGNWESRLKSRIRVKAINLSGVPGEIRQQSGRASTRRGLVSVHRKSDFNMALRNQSLAHFLAVFMLSYPASFGVGLVGILPGFFPALERFHICWSSVCKCSPSCQSSAVNWDRTVSVFFG